MRWLTNSYDSGDVRNGKSSKDEGQGDKASPHISPDIPVRRLACTLTERGIPWLAFSNWGTWSDPRVLKELCLLRWEERKDLKWFVRKGAMINQGYLLSFGSKKWEELSCHYWNGKDSRTSRFVVGRPGTQLWHFKVEMSNRHSSAEVK